jgi:CheY-like chemotaxis protein/Tfp pilus assembly protein PilZ
MAEVPHSRIRVLVVDQDPAVRALLQRELGAAGYEVDTLSSGDGFTEDMVQLIRPDVLLVDPFIGDVPLPAVEELLAHLRQDHALVLLLIDGGRDPERLSQIARDCRADGQLQKRDLLRAPATAVGEQLLPDDTLDAEIVEIDVSEDDLPTAVMVAESGEEIVLDEVARPVRQPPAPPPARPTSRSHPTHPDLLAMIEEELDERSPPPPAAPNPVLVEINLFSRHNFYVGGSGDLRTGGVFVVTTVLPQVGSSVPLQLEVPSASPLLTVATVEWVRESSQVGRISPGVGLSLRHLPEHQREALQLFFQERAPLTYLPNRR